MVHRFMQLNPKARLHASTAMDHGWIQKHHSVSRDASSLSSISEDEIVECDQQQQQQPPLWRSEVTRRVSAPLGQLSPRTTLLSQRQVAAGPSHHLPSQVASAAHSQATLAPMAGPPLPPQRSPREGHKVGLDAPSLPPFPTTVTAADLVSPAGRDRTLFYESSLLGKVPSASAAAAPSGSPCHSHCGWASSSGVDAILLAC
ncbi:hypothetical protein FOZ63_000401 [Perkinsus olseni]|uniref:Uncharacterized protein n=1 Tax=Perkinsus olseni TaxID=32597 RepID=A0A7J6QKJ4_PEROL|nr:hypothetical protein FOZ63_000401 [Perkinsus olseni]